MTRIRPRALVHRGHVPAVGLLLEAALVPAERMRARVLSLWEPGCRVLSVDGGLLLRWPRARVLEANGVPGHPVVDDRGLLLAVPLTAREREGFAAAAGAGAIVAARGGAAVLLAAGAEVDPSTWLGLAPVLVAVDPLGGPPPPPEPPPPPADPRSVLGIAPAAEGAAEATRAISEAVARASPEDASAARAAPAPGPPRPPRRLPPFLRRAWTRFVFASRLARLAGLAHGAYLRRMLALFDRGDVAEALRHALPLARPGAEQGTPALLPPRPRSGLQLSPHGAVTVGSIRLGHDLHVHLTDLYRRTAERLEAQGRIEEAAFVLAELLQAEEEAVWLLERHGEFRKAAELAEGRELPADLVVRQWFLAGDVERALRVARARRVYADVVARLERSGRAAQADAFRLLWAEDLAEAGDLEGAVGVAWSVDAARAIVGRWIELAVAQGGLAGLALLARRLEREPERFAEVAGVATGVASDGSEEGRARRAALERGLLAVGPGPGVRRIARIVARGQLADAPRAGDGEPGARLLRLADDAALGQDLPRRGRPRTPGSITFTVGLEDRGLHAALDAAVLPGGRVLVALGEPGAALLTRDGRTVARFDVPAHRLVVSALGTRALALAQRGDVVRVSRLDLGARTAAPLRDLHLLDWADAFDGVRWAVSTGRQVLVLDALRDDLRVLWNLNDLPGTARGLAQHGDWLTFETTAPDGREGWRYEGLVLRERAALLPPSDPDMGRAVVTGVHAGDGWRCVAIEGDRALVLEDRAGGARGPLLPPGVALTDARGGSVMSVATSGQGGAEVRVNDPRDFGILATISVPGAPQARVRNAGALVTVADPLGRVIGLDVEAGHVTHDLRV